MNLSSSNLGSYRIVENNQNRRSDTTEPLTVYDEKSGMYMLNPKVMENDQDESAVESNDGSRNLNVFFDPYDDRTFIEERSYPLSTIGKVAFRKKSSSYSSTCSGTLVGPRHVATAAHCVQDYFGVPHEDIVFLPNTIDGKSADKASWRRMYVSEYIPNYDSKDHVDHDWALLVLDKSIGYDFGWMPMDHNLHVGEGEEGSGSTFYVAGYSADRSRQTASISEHCSVKYLSIDGMKIYHNCDANGGASGGPAGFVDETGRRYLSGVQAYHKCNKQSNPDCHYDEYHRSLANVAISASEISCYLEMDMHRIDYDSCSRLPTTGREPNLPVPIPDPECEGHSDCEFGEEFCNTSKLCTSCLECSEDIAIDSSCPSCTVAIAALPARRPSKSGYARPPRGSEQRTEAYSNNDAAPLPTSLRKNPLSQNIHHLPDGSETSAPMDAGSNNSYATYTALGGCGFIFAAAGLATYWISNKLKAKAVPRRKEDDRGCDTERDED